MTRHAPGDFCWVELMTSDAVAAKTFYSALLGWQTHDDAIPGGGTYTMIVRDEGNVGGLYQLNDEMKSRGIPPNWLSYVSVDDAAAAAERCLAAGGLVNQAAFDVMDIGRMAVLQDPGGAVFAVWQPKKHTGAHHTDKRPGTVCWNELMTHDTDASTRFYSELFGWKPTVQELGKDRYTVFMNGERQAAGMLQIKSEWGPVLPNWLVYFAVDDCDGFVGRAQERLGRTFVPPTDIPDIGRFSVMQDPQGAGFAVIQLG